MTVQSQSKQGESWTITVCPDCGEYRPFSAIDAIHGGEPRCTCGGVVTQDGVIMGMTGPLLVGVEVVPANPNWRGLPGGETRVSDRPTEVRGGDALHWFQATDYWQQKVESLEAEVSRLRDQNAQLKMMEVDTLYGALRQERDEAQAAARAMAAAIKVYFDSDCKVAGNLWETDWEDWLGEGHA